MKKLKDALENTYMFYNGEDIRSAIWDHYMITMMLSTMLSYMAMVLTVQGVPFLP